MTGSSSNLRSRAAGKEVAKSDDTLGGQIKAMESQFQLAMPKGVEAAQLVRDALTSLRTTPGLAECSPTSVLGSLMTCAQLGLRPGVLGHAWLLPFWDSKSRSKKAQLVVGYQGLIELAFRSGRISSLIARTVHENDTFDVDYGLNDRLVHKPCMVGDPGDPVAYYAIVKFKDGGHAFYVMSHDQMLRYRDLYASTKSKDGRVFGPWADNFEAMAHKTCVRQLAKWMPKSTELATALEVDEGVRVNVDPTADVAQATYRFDTSTGEVIDGEVVEDEQAEGKAEPDADDPWAGDDEKAKG